MAKNAPVKKSKRKLKRSVRRSIAAVLMITAIGVAAVPVPENYAETGISPYDDDVPVLPYSYKVSSTGTDVANEALKYNKDKHGDLSTAYIINALSDGTYQMDWQFKFYQTVVNGVYRGIISQYNGTYAQERVELRPNVPTGYVKVTQKEFDAVFDEKNYTDSPGLFKYSVEDPKLAKDVDVAFFTKWFEKPYQDYVNTYDAQLAKYEEDHAKWVAAGEEDPNRGAEPTKPKFEKTLADLTLEQKYEYYCENKGYTGCTLAVVIDSTQEVDSDATGGESASGNNTNNVRVYIPKGTPKSQIGGYMTDKDGFLYKDDASIIGIGDAAFKLTTNVKYLTVPEEIKYIGTSAFEHSFLKEINLVNVQEICDRAFKDCGDLTSVTIGDGATRIGMESFYGTGISSVVFPSSISQIGPGAFAGCSYLQKIDFSAISGSNITVKEYAFYNATALNEVVVMRSGSTDVGVNITTLGDCAFAVDSVLTGNMTDFTFPLALSAPSNGENSIGLGDYVLAGRSNLLRVVMPRDFGANLPAKVPDGTFYNCFNLEYVRFPDSCGRASYTPGTKEKAGLFSTVGNPDFYVWGPENDPLGNKALPRISTWDAVTAVSEVVPYRYDRGNQQFYEVSDGDYLLCIDNNGVLTSCTRKDTTKDLGDKLIDLEIPAKVGETEVTGIASNCFTDDHLNQHVKSVTIMDNSKLTTINAGVFSGWKKLKKVYIGNSVTTIGDNAFKDCVELVDVTFASPKGGHAAFTVGKDAFKTQSSQLTFHGDIVVGYAPFEWAMDPGNIIEETGETGGDPNTALRVCYKSLAPTYLTVMYNPVTDMVTMVDYPKFTEIDSILNEEYAEQIKELNCTTYQEYRERTLYNQYKDARYDGYRQDFAAAWLAAGDDENAKNAVYNNSNLYGPWVNPEFCANEEWKKYLPVTSNGATEEEDTSSDLSSRISDLLFEPIIAYAAEGDPIPFYSKNHYIVSKATPENSDPFFPYTTQEQGLVSSTLDIVVPAGVESIDVWGYVNNLTKDGEKSRSGNNNINYTTYLRYDWDSLSRDMYEVEHEADEDGIKSVPGLFSGYYKDGEAALNEKRTRGNDVIRSVTMHTVKYLPDYAFDSCENLQWVVLGTELSDIGKAPFRGCYSLTNVGDNDYYTTVDGIVYSNNSDGSRTIEECLAARGNLVGFQYINADNDPNIKSVSAIRESAFEDCDYITGVDFDRDNTAGLMVIPEDCFKNADSLGTVVLPATVNSVKSGAFVGANKLGSLTVYGREVDIDDGAFNTDKLEEHKQWTSVQAYADSAVVRYVERLGEKYGLRYDNVHPLGEWWSVSFYDANYELIEDLKDIDGDPLANPQYVKDGERLTTPQSPANTDDWTFERWVGVNNLKLNDPIHENATFYAQGYTTSGMVNGRYPVSFWDGVDGSQVGPMQYIDPGSDAIAPPHPVHAGYTADGYSDTYTNVQSPKTIIMKYKATSTSGGGGTNTPGTSGGGTNTPGTTSGQTTSSTSNTSTSSGSTSTTSSSSDSTATAAGLYTVTVINGSGSGNYAAGATVLIQANTPAAGSVFSKWVTESQGVSLASVSTTPTTFTMPANNVTITAEFTAAATPVSNSGSTGNSGGTTGNGNTRVDITKPGISNKDLATANVNGSTDNFIVKITETDEATRAVQEALTNKYGSLESLLYYAMDISLYDSTGTYKITDTSGLSVDITIPIPDALVMYGGNNMAGAVINGNQLESLNESFTTINGVPCIRFTATHFSPYTVYVDTGNLTEGMLDTTPKTGDPIHPKWFLSIGLAGLSVILFMKKDKAVKVKTA